MLLSDGNRHFGKVRLEFVEPIVEGADERLLGNEDISGVCVGDTWIAGPGGAAVVAP